MLAGLGIGAVAHAGELGGNGEVTGVTEWLHGEGDHDQVPADSDSNVPHHHNVCHGHDLAAAPKSGAPTWFATAVLHRPAAETPPIGASPATLLRPPIA